MSSDLVVFMPHYEGVDEKVYDNNFQSFVRFNPDIPIVRFDEETCKDPYWQRIRKDRHLSWRNSDLLIYDFYRQNPQYGHYLYVEWDTYCTMDVRKLVDPIRQFDLASRWVVYPEHERCHWIEPEWQWLPKELYRRVTVPAPMCGMTFSAKALSKLAVRTALHDISIHCEIRIGALNKLNDLTLAAYPVYARGLRAELIPTSHMNNEGIWHQVKRCLSSNKPSSSCPAIGLWLGSHPNWTAVVSLKADGRIAMNGRDSGRWAYFDDGELTLMWDDYAPERLKRTDNGFAEGGFSLVHLDSLPAQPTSKEKLVTYGPLLPDSAFKPIVDAMAVRRNWYFYQTPGNLGDKLIARGTHQFFSKLDRNVILNPMPERWDPAEVGVIFAGGGNLGTYKNSIEAREQVLNRVRGSSTPVVVLPQSGNQKLEFSDVTTLFVRETETQALYPGAILAPDMAMFATISAPEVTPHRKFGIFLRIDGEGIIATKHGRDPYEMFSTLEECALAILRCRTIVTDRLHFAILALMLKREVVLLPNSYHKNRSMYETWLKDLGCKWADDAVEWTGEKTFKRSDPIKLPAESKTQAQ